MNSGKGEQMSRQRSMEVIEQAEYVTIGELVRLTAVRYSTLKFYTEEGMLPFEQAEENACLKREPPRLKSKSSRGGSLFTLHTMKSLTDNLTCIRYQDKCCWLILLDIVTKLDCLRAVECSEDNIFFISGKCTLGIYNSCAAV